MKLANARKVLSLAGVLLMLGVAAPAMGAPTSQDAEHFRQVVYERSLALERALNIEGPSQLILNASEQTMLIWFEAVNNKEKFFAASERLLDRAHAAALFDGGAEAPRFAPETMTRAGAPSPMASPIFPLPIDPEYPPGSGSYWAAVGSFLEDFDYIEAYWDSCDPQVWGDAYIVWEVLFAARVTTELLCMEFSCDPTGVACFVECIPAVVAIAAEEIARVPLELCSIQDGNVAAAETQAGLNNINAARMDIYNHAVELEGHQTALTSHDAKLALHNTALSGHDGNLGVHDTEVQAQLGQTLHALDHKVELRRVHIELVNAKGVSDSDSDSDGSGEYLVATTEGGQPVDVEFIAVDGMKKKKKQPAGFFDIRPKTTIARLEEGSYLVSFHRRVGAKIFRLRVRHDDVVDHFGEVLFRK